MDKYKHNPDPYKNTEIYTLTAIPKYTLAIIIIIEQYKIRIPENTN